jgi:hypothetical protein
MPPDKLLLVGHLEEHQPLGLLVPVVGQLGMFMGKRKSSMHRLRSLLPRRQIGSHQYKELGVGLLGLGCALICHGPTVAERGSVVKRRKRAAPSGGRRGPLSGSLGWGAPEISSTLAELRTLIGIVIKS